MRVKTKKKMSRNDRIYHICAYTGFGLLALLCAYPFYFLLISTISDNQLVNLGRITVLPKGIHFDNYLQIFKLQNLSNAFFIQLPEP